jgi:uncharacterized membrane protein
MAATRWTVLINDPRGSAMKVTRLGHVIFALSFAGIGVLSLVSGDFALNWQPVPAWVPWREAIAYASGLMLLAGGLGMLPRRTARLATLLITVNVLLWLLLLRLPRVVAQPTNEGMWLGFGETLMLVTGGWTLLGGLAVQDGSSGVQLVTGSQGLRLARFLYGAALPLVGLSHFVYLEGVASMVPAWLPFHVGFAYLTGAGHIAAGLGILFGVLPRLAATLEAMMISLFTLLVWVPGLAASPPTRLAWTAFFVSAALSGAAWAIAGPLQDTAWGLSRWTVRRAATSPGSA